MGGRRRIVLRTTTTKYDMLLMLLMIGREDPTVGVVMSMSTLGIEHDGTISRRIR